MSKLCLIIIAVVLVLLPAGCSLITVSTTSSTGMCASVPEDEVSVICQIAEAKGIEPETVARVLYLAEVGYLEADKDASQDTMKFLQEVRAHLVEVRDLGQQVTFIQALNYIDGKWEVLPEKVKLAITILDPEAFKTITITSPLGQYDMTKLIECVDNLITIAGVYT